MLYMNVLLRATVCDNLSEKRREKKNTLVFELSVGYLSTSIRSALGLRRPHTACDYLHPSEMIKSQVSRINVTAENSLARYKGLSALGAVMGRALKNQEIRKGSFFIKASLIDKNFF